MSNSNPNDSNYNPTTPINITTTRGRRGSIASSIPALSTSPTSPLQTPASVLSLRLNQHARARSGSGSGSGSGSDDGFKGGPGSSPTSPLAYFLGTTSPMKTTTGAGNGGGFFGGKIVSAMDESDDGPPGAGAIGLFGVGGHTRRASTSWAQGAGAGVGTMPPAVPQSPTNARGTGVLRRLSLSTTFQRPTFGSNSPPNVPAPPPPSAVSPAKSFAAPTPKPPTPPFNGNGRHQPLRRAATLAVSDPVKKRGISPMGERLLKGQFDGF